MTVQSPIWVVDDDASTRWVFEKALAKSGYEVRGFSHLGECEEALKQGEPSALILDIRLPDGDGLDFLSVWSKRFPRRPVIVVTAHADFQNAIQAYEKGAFEYLPKPIDLRELMAVLERALSHPDSGEKSRKRGPSSTLIGAAPAMQRVFRQIGRLARSEVTVLVRGESGTGKELVARALHAHGPRTKGPFIAINAAAIPAELLETELFGHERGAFTGAVTGRTGRFEQAQGGTLFLDEIGDMPLPLQTRLLRVIAEHEFFRVGGEKTVATDARLVAATHQDLATLVQAGRFREDLYHRLNVVEIRLPPLRERLDDLPLLLEHFLREASAEFGLPAPRLTAEAVGELQQWPWRGNIRELVNFCRKIVLEPPGPFVQVEDLENFRSDSHSVRMQEWGELLGQWCHTASPTEYGQALKKAERILIEVALERTGGHRQEAARLLGLGRNTLTRKLARWKENL